MQEVLIVGKRVYYSTPGTLSGHVPGGQFVHVQHLTPGQSNFRVRWAGYDWTDWLFAGLVEDEFGIRVKVKRSGPQEGHPAEAVTRAVWRHFADRYNEWDPDVEFSP